MAYEFIMPGHVMLGEGALEQSRTLLGRLGSRALVVTDNQMIKVGNWGFLEKMLEEAGISYAVYSKVNGEPTDVMVEEGLKIYREEHCDCLIALGGGSPIDAMKAIGVLAVNGGSIADYMGKEICGQIPGMAAIPTTAGTGSETTRFTIITDTKRQIKMLLRGNTLMPKLAIVDPKLMSTAPPSVIAASGLDALTHGIEAYTSKKATPLTDLYALSAVKRIMKSLPAALRGNEIEEMALGAFEAGVAFNNSSVTVIHGMSRPIGALFHVPHGISNAMLLDTCLLYIIDGDSSRFGKLGCAVLAADEKDSDEEAGRKFLEEVRKLCRYCKIPTLEEYRIDKKTFYDNMEKMAEDALESGSPANTRKQLSKKDILRMYDELWK